MNNAADKHTIPRSSPRFQGLRQDSKAFVKFSGPSPRFRRTEIKISRLEIQGRRCTGDLGRYYSKIHQIGGCVKISEDDVILLKEKVDISKGER